MLKYGPLVVPADLCSDTLLHVCHPLPLCHPSQVNYGIFILLLLLRVNPFASASLRNDHPQLSLFFAVLVLLRRWWLRGRVFLFLVIVVNRVLFVVFFLTIEGLGSNLDLSIGRLSKFKLNLVGASRWPPTGPLRYLYLVIPPTYDYFGSASILFELGKKCLIACGLVGDSMIHDDNKRHTSLSSLSSHI